MSDEKALIKAAAGGDVKAFEALIEEHKKTVYNISYRMSGNYDDAMDMSQEIFIKLFKNIGKFRGKSKFSTWVYRIATNTCLDEMRKIKNKTAYSLDSEIETDEGSFTAELEDKSPTPEDALQAVEIKDAINEALKRLSDDHRQVVILRDIQNMSYDEIAVILNCSVGTVKSRLSRGRRALQKILLENRELFEAYFTSKGM